MLGLHGLDKFITFSASFFDREPNPMIVLWQMYKSDHGMCFFDAHSVLIPFRTNYNLYIALMAHVLAIWVFLSNNQ